MPICNINLYKEIKNEYDLHEFNKIDEGLRKLNQRGRISLTFRNKILNEVIQEINGVKK